MIFQEPMTALNPVSPVGRQIAEMFVLHQGKDWREATSWRSRRWPAVRVPAPERRVKDYPHQLSGGMRQRVMIANCARMRAGSSDRRRADHRAHVTVQAEIIELMRALCAERGTAILMISHDLGLVAMLPAAAPSCMPVASSRSAVRTISSAPARTPIRKAWSTRCRGSAAAPPWRTRLTEIAGVVPAITNFPNGCRSIRVARRQPKFAAPTRRS